MGIGAGDEVICPSFTFYATAGGDRPARRHARLRRHRPSDAEPRPRKTSRGRITPRTKAIMPVHLFGRPAPLAELAALGIPIVEDAAQAFGAEGSRAHRRRLDLQLLPDEEPLRPRATAASSPRPTTELAERVRLLRFHGSRDKVDFELVGLQLAARRAPGGRAAALPAKPLDGWNQARREAAARYAELGLGELCELPADDGRHVYHMYVVRTPERDRIAAALTAAEISCASYYVTPLHLQPALRFLGWEPGSLPETERAARENLALPMWAGIDESDAGAGRVGRAPGARRECGADLAADQPAPPLAARRRRLPRRRRVVPRLPPPLRPEDPALLPHAVHADDLDRDR